jgi:mannose-6-phosphate isomerase-like protein (cupin superfamily)|tara:strand:+ start:2644 stop:3030 length:387 start_codon:yes stop_codon:yes gene_type:complete
LSIFKGDELMSKINLKEKLSLFSEHWSPKVISELNDYQIKLVKIKGDFVWHNHSETDELFLVIDGEMKIEFKDKTVELNKGEMYVVPKGVEHRPYAENECEIMLIEPKDVVNTGEKENDLTASNDVWI